MYSECVSDVLTNRFSLHGFSDSKRLIISRTSSSDISMNGKTETSQNATNMFLLRMSFIH